MSVRDGRKAPFVWAAVDTLAYLRESWSTTAGVSIGHGLSVYHGLTELANEQYARANTQGTASGEFTTSRAEICERAGISDKPVDKAIRELERIGLLRVERSGARASAYVLCEVDEARSGVTPHLEEESATEQVRSRSGESPQPGPELLRTAPYKEKKEKKKEKHTVDGRSKRKVGGVVVTDSEHAVAAEIVTAFNAVAGTAVTVEAHLTPIVGRIREKPDLTADDHRGIIAAVFAVPWWSGGASPAVIYGNAAQFERSIETWRAAAPANLHLVPTGGAVREPTKSEIRSLVRARSVLRATSAYGLWVRPLRLAGISADTVYLVAPEGIRAWCERRYSSLLAEALAAEGLPGRVSFAAVEITDRRAAA